MSNRKFTMLAALAISAACAGFSSDASACGGGWFGEEEVEIDYRPFGIAMAEKQLEAGDYDAAAGTVLRVIPHLKNYKTASRDEIINRAMRVMAVSIARNAKEIDLKSQMEDYVAEMWLQGEEPEAQADLEWAVTMLTELSKKKADDVVFQSELGEAMAKSDKHRDEGRALLEKLAAKDLLTSPEAYKALADLRALAGNEDGRTAALERCKAMAKDAKICLPTS